MGRSKPKTTVRKLLCLGPRSGFVYQVEDFPEVGSLVVRAPNGSAVAQFIRAAMREPGKAGLVYQTGQGDPRMLELIRRDFGIEAKLAAVPSPEAGSGKREAGSSENLGAMPPAPEGYEWRRVGGSDEYPSLIAVKKGDPAYATAATTAEPVRPPKAPPVAGRSTP